MTPAPDPSWEGRHPSHREFWSFDFCAPGADLGGFIGLTLHPRPQSGAWYWAALVGARRPYLLVRDLEIQAPRRPGSREIRADGLWAAVNCETPFDHWSLGLEAFGVALDDPEEALGAERGDRTGLGLDLEWEAVGDIAGGEADYAQPCNVHGEILVGMGSSVETIPFEGHGWRRHAWAPAPAPAGLEGEHLWGHLADGTPHRWGPIAGESPASKGEAAITESPGEAPPVTEVLFRAPLRLDARRVLERSLCRFTTGTASGIGWHERVTRGR